MLLLLALVSLARAIIAEPLPSSIVVFHPADGTIANSSADAAWHYGINGTGTEGDYLQRVEFSLTHPNGTVSGGGGVSSGGCLMRGGVYTFGFNNSQAGDYVSCALLLVKPRKFSPPRLQMLEALVSLATEVDGVCPGPEGHQNSTVSFKWRWVAPLPCPLAPADSPGFESSVAPNPDGSSSSGETPTPVTKTATFAQAPTGTYTPERSASGASREAVGVLAALLVGGSAMALLA